MVLYGGAALVVLVGVVLVGLRAASRVAGEAGLFCALAALAVVLAIVGRDVVLRRWSPVSVGAMCLYVLCLLAVIALDFAGA